MTTSTMRLVRPAAVVTLAVALLTAGPAGAISGGSDVNDDYPFVAKLSIGDFDRACSGVLVHPQVVLTAAACFAGPDGSVISGEPNTSTTALVGRSNTAGTGGTVSVVTDVIAHPDRDVAVARLETPVTGVAPVSIATTAPDTGETLTLAGYGRTAEEWITGRLKSARFTVDQVGAGTLEMVPTGGEANVCKGDAGGPVFRESDGTFQLVGLHHTSNQVGCLGEPAGTPRATETRLDDLTDWVTSNLPGFSTGLETTDARPNWQNTVNARSGGGGLSNVGGFCCSLTAPELKVTTESPHSGARALLYSGKDANATKSFAYTVAYQLAKMQIRPSSTLSYWIFPQSKNAHAGVEGSNSSCVAVDLVFTDGTNLRDSGVKDQRDTQVHPAKQCGKLTLDTWNQVVVPLGRLAGKQIATVGLGYDQPALTGGYRGYLDDLAITDTLAPPKFSTGLESGQPALTWTNTTATVKPSGGLRNVGGVCCSLTGPETALRAERQVRTGTNALMYSGKDNDATSSFAYTKAFAPADVFVTPSTRLSYWIHPQSKSGNGNVSGSNSSCASVDLIFVDRIDDTSVSLRDSSARDQRGLRVHPLYQCDRLTLDTWNFVTVPLGAVANGKQISQIDIGYDQPANTGGYRGLIDDLRITQ